MAEIKDGPVRRCLPVAQWPEADRAAWAAAHRRGGLLDDDGLAASWAPATNTIIAGGYGRFLSYLAETEGLDPTAVAPGSRSPVPASRPMSPICASAITRAPSPAAFSNSAAPQP